MLTDDQLAARIGPRLRAELAGLPTPDMLAALRRRRARRARVTTAVTTLPVVAAAIAAALVLNEPAAPAVQHAQDTAYVDSHVTQALDAVPAGTISYLRMNFALHSDVTVTWDRGPARLVETFRAGQLVFKSGTAVTSTTMTSVYVNYQDRTWHRSVMRVGPPSAAARPPAISCDNARQLGIPGDASRMVTKLRVLVSCGMLKADGTATVGGVTAIRLTTPANNGFTTAWYISPVTYLPIREATTWSGRLLEENDFQWLPPTTANLAKLNLPTVPPGFTQESTSACNQSPGC
jgi:hypothetical protein